MTVTTPPPGMRYHPDDAVRHLRDADPVLGRLVDRLGPCTLRPEPDRTLFDRLASSIVSQQLSVKAAATIGGRLRVACGGGMLRPEAVALLSDEDLRASGLSRPKVAAIRDLSDAVTSRRIPTVPELDDLDDEEVVAALTVVRGIGRWTVEMLLLFQLGRPDVWPVADVGIRRAVERLHALDERCGPEELLHHSEPWAPYRSVASWYLWRSLDATPDA